LSLDIYLMSGVERCGLIIPVRVVPEILILRDRQVELVAAKSGDEILSCTVLMCGPNDLMAKLHRAACWSF
jgi:hypothetical protein